MKRVKKHAEMLNKKHNKRRSFYFIGGHTLGLKKGGYENMGASPWMFFHRDCNQVIGEVSQLLTSSNLTVIESFDLQAARANQHNCDCPQHGTEQCTCQLAILLVYGDDNAPVSLMIDGNSERTELSIIETPGQTIDPEIKGKITATLRANDFTFADQEIMYDASG